MPKINKKGIERLKLLQLILILMVALVIFYIWFEVILPNLFPK